MCARYKEYKPSEILRKKEIKKENIRFFIEKTPTRTFRSVYMSVCDSATMCVYVERITSINTMLDNTSSQEEGGTSL